MSINKSEYIGIFIEESIDYIDQLDIHVVNLEKNKSDQETIKKIYRIMHTLKGICGIVGFSELSTLMHTVENLFSQLIEKNIKVSEKIIEGLYHIIDILKGIISNLQKGKKPGIDFKKEASHFKDFINSQVGLDTEVKEEDEKYIYTFNIEAYKDKIIPAIKQKKKLYSITFTIDKDEELKNSRRRIFFKKLNDHGEVLDYYPKRDNDYYTEDEIEIKLLFIGKLTNQVLKILKKIDRINNLTYKEISERDFVTEKEEPGEDITQIDSESKHISDESTIKVKVNKLDKLLNYAQELTIINLSFQNFLEKMKKNRSASDIITTLDNSIDSLSKTTQSMHQEIMRARMVPVGNLFRRFWRPTRDISKSFGKKVALKIIGEEEEIDKNTVDLLFEPILHLVRNAIDHGIEPPDERALLSKEEQAKLVLRSYSKQNRLFIEVSDDGRGIDTERIREQALNKGIISEGNEISNDELLDLIFLPSFSTKEKANELAGRGMGMNIVKEAVKKIKGEIKIQTEKEKGTRFVISLPSTLAIISALIVESSAERYAIPLSPTKEILSIESEKIQTVYSKKTFNFRGKILPLISLEEYFELDSSHKVPDELTVLVIDSEGMEYGLIVETIIGKQEIVTKPLSLSLLSIKGISGVTIIGDGTIVLIIDVDAIGKNFNGR